MPIYFHNEDVPYRLLHQQKVKIWIAQIIQSHSKKLGTINYIFCSDEFLLEKNRTYLNHDYYTDIITFDDVEGDLVSGDVFISIERVKYNAQDIKVTVEEELHRVLIHGVLHLLSYKDKSPSDKAQMRSAEDKSLSLRDF